MGQGWNTRFMSKIRDPEPNAVAQHRGGVGRRSSNSYITRCRRVPTTQLRGTWTGWRVSSVALLLIYPWGGRSLHCLAWNMLTLTEPRDFGGNCYSGNISNPNLSCSHSRFRSVAIFQPPHSIHMPTFTQKKKG